MFNERFPAYLAELLDMDASAQALGQYLHAEKNVSHYADYFRSLREKTARELMDSIDRRTLNRAIQSQKDATKRKQLEHIRANWQVLRAWLFGVEVYDAREKKQKRITGMIPLREDVLKMFLDTGWEWGGDWRREKDYMHFEDPRAMKQVSLNTGRKP